MIGKLRTQGLNKAQIAKRLQWTSDRVDKFIRRHFPRKNRPPLGYPPIYHIDD
jgi:hypothetical protein